ncbi:hemerythrin family protein [Rhodospirillaceae bacterium KN72]|uniref:Hemerythrin family protein n=1 Tax=Pacificispira spongiicola TaxID=2729598 RepID=A0A7Y0E0L3_9PROT|nr:hemerythrin family protein [Pacificispira spongiicola]NMM45047.1 hemerythrin family protein [Pacificispira spongiicola]
MGYFLPTAFQLGIQEVDDQHHALVDLTNVCADLIEAGQEKDACPPLKKFIHLLEDHFHKEEAMMERMGYPGLDWHREHHADALRVTQKVFDTCRANEQITAGDIADLFNNVIMDIVRADLKFAEYLEGRGDLRRP